MNVSHHSVKKILCQILKQDLVALRFAFLGFSVVVLCLHWITYLLKRESQPRKSHDIIIMMLMDFDMSKSEKYGFLFRYRGLRNFQTTFLTLKSTNSEESWTESLGTPDSILFFLAVCLCTRRPGASLWAFGGLAADIARETFQICSVESCAATDFPCSSLTEKLSHCS